MIYIYTTIKDDNYTLLMPYEINNQFLGIIDRAPLNNQIPYDFRLLGASDFGDIIIPNAGLDEYLFQLDRLVQNLDEVMKYCPLPKTIWGFDGRMFEGYISLRNSNGADEIEISDTGIPFSKEEMLLFLAALKKKALEAKSKNAGIVFAGD